MDGLVAEQSAELASAWPQRHPGPNRLMRTLTAAPQFRSASVDELILKDDFFRRPLRPEDLAFLDFSEKLGNNDFGRLSCLMAQRTLLSLTESLELALPGTAPEGPSAFDRFYDPGLREVGSALAPQLRHHVFASLDADGTVPLQTHLDLVSANARYFWRDCIGKLGRQNYRPQGLALILIQNVPLWKSVWAGEPRLYAGSASARLMLSWSDGVFAISSHALEDAAGLAGLSTGRHSYWQFYLTGALATVNLLHSFASSAATICEYAGARLVAEADRLQLCEAIGLDTGPFDAAGELRSRAAAQLAVLTGSLGGSAAGRVAAGASRMASLLRHAHADLAAQLGWLADIGTAQRAAAEISARIEREAPGIDRDTFVEPREMCSTTHVHDEHRLVVVESGEMVFWGNLGMQHRMGPGEMILIPKYRLHGSSVLTQSCTYHQPIIPDDWRAHIPVWLQAAF